MNQSVDLWHLSEQEPTHTSISIVRGESTSPVHSPTVISTYMHTYLSRSSTQMSSAIDPTQLLLHEYVHLEYVSE